MSTPADEPVRTCSACGQVLQDLTRPCRTCGSTRRTTHMHFEGSVKPSGTIAGITVNLGPERPWYEQWYSVRQHLELVEFNSSPDAYQGNDALRRDLESFFVECVHLGDWLWHDKSTGLSKAEVKRYINNHPALNICLAAANVKKHHTRDNPNAMTARISSVGFDTNGVHASISWSEGSNSGIEDAFDLARRCVKAWESYLQGHGLQSPI